LAIFSTPKKMSEPGVIRPQKHDVIFSLPSLRALGDQPALYPAALHQKVSPIQERVVVLPQKHFGILGRLVGVHFAHQIIRAEEAPRFMMLLAN
jgi:hypothetical protein